MRTPPASPRPTGAALDTRRESIERRILEGAAELIEEGVAWNALGIRQITERAEISRTAFYSFFASKNEVLEHLVSGLHDELGQLLVEGGPADEALVDLGELPTLLSMVADYLDEHGRVYRAFLDAAAEDQRLDDLWDDLVQVFVDLVSRSIVRARDLDGGLATTPDAASLARVLLLMTERTLLLLPRDVTRRPATLEALGQVWQRSVFAAAAHGAPA